MKYRLSEKEIQVMEAILAKGNRVELIPCKNGMKILDIKWNPVNIESSQPRELG